MIVDDQPPFRAAARAVVDRVAGFELVAEVASGEEAVETSADIAPQLVLMDINMGELDGIEATRIITGSDPSVKVILVSTYALDDLPPARAPAVRSPTSTRTNCHPASSAASGSPAATPTGRGLQQGSDP